MFYICHDSRKKKQKYRFIFLFFLNGCRSLRDEGITNENSNGMKKQADKERVRERESERDQRRV